ncbi:MAG TPA: iron-sulfur cluster repair di-iron protein [Blastocatellia bacterium]|nr:iron-sulfur cluster repair di-iron protein [Blastocatellia bacterium]
MQINTAKTVRDLAVEIPGATRVFEKVGIDYCCGGGKTFQEACAAAGVSADDVARSLEQAKSSSAAGADAAKWQTQRLSKLTSYIVKKHHVFTRDELGRLAQLLSKVCSVHGQNHPELIRIQSLFEELSRDLIPHMQKEEMVLFPYIEELDIAVSGGATKPVPHFGTVANPVRMMMMEHDMAGDILKEIRQLSGGFVVPEGVCISYETLYKALDGLEQDLHQHIHLENNILFPRAVEMENN